MRLALLCALCLLVAAAVAAAAVQQHNQRSSPFIFWASSDEALAKDPAHIMSKFQSAGEAGLAVAMVVPELSSEKFSRLAGAYSSNPDGGVFQRTHASLRGRSRAGVVELHHDTLSDSSVLAHLASSLSAADQLHSAILLTDSASVPASVASMSQESLDSLTSRLANKRRGHVVLFLDDMSPERVDAIVAKAVEVLHARRAPFMAFFTSDVAEPSSTVQNFATVTSFSGSSGGGNNTNSTTTRELYTSSNAMNGIFVTFMLFLFVFIGLRCLFSIEMQEEFPEEESDDKKQR